MRSVVVLGLGRFGSALAVELTCLGVEVLGVDQDETVVQDHDGRLTHVVRADITREEVHSQQGGQQIDWQIPPTDSGTASTDRDLSPSGRSAPGSPPARRRSTDHLG